MTIFTIIIAILIFAVIILVHELGHFGAARLFKIKVHEFNIGMGPTLLRKRGKETNYQLKAIPFGGSCRLGEDDEESDDPRAFRNKPVWQRMIVILAGAFLNLVLGFILCVIIVSMGKNAETTIVNESYNNLLQPRDVITHINGMRIFTIADINYQLVNAESKIGEDDSKILFDFTVIRDGKKLQLNDVEFYAVPKQDGTGKEIAVDISILREEKNLPRVITVAGKQTLSYSRLIIITLVDMVKGTYGLNEISGPVGAVSVIGEASSAGFKQSASEGIRMSLIMAALISINVGIFNLLPVPALDGARFLFFVIEAIRRKPVRADIEGMIHFIGFAALMLFMLLITVLDIGKLVGG